MGVIRAVFGGLGRWAVLFVLIVAALVAHRMLRPSFQSFDELRTSVEQLENDREALGAYVRQGVRDSDAAVAQGHRRTREALDGRIRDLARERDRLREGYGGDLRAVLAGGAGAVIENRKRGVRIALATREIESLTALRDTLDARRPGETLREAVGRQTAAMRRAKAANERSVARVKRIDASLYDRLRYRDERARRVREAKESAEAYRTSETNARRLVASQRRLNASTAAATRAVGEAGAELDRLLAERRRKLGDNEVEWARSWADRVGLGPIAAKAGLILVGVIVTPFLIRAFLYWIVAPLAARRPAIRLRIPGGGATSAPLGERSATSVAIRLRSNEELFVRQGFLQSSPHGGVKRTRWLLDHRHPFSSVAAGLTFLTRIRGTAEDATTISAVEDPFAEVAVLALPDGAACVLQPRALAAVAQPIDRPLRVTSHWRLLSLNAWLTLQLRFLVFHGPARLAIKGGRGVRIEPARRGRVFGQDQLVGFSADLSYSVTRTETFAPYLFGREALLKDKVVGGEGVLIVEEVPMAGRGRAGVRRGLEGAFDAALKVVGI